MRCKTWYHTPIFPPCLLESTYFYSFGLVGSITVAQIMFTGNNFFFVFALMSSGNKESGVNGVNINSKRFLHPAKKVWVCF